jgi:nitronate monooxygenase
MCNEKMPQLKLGNNIIVEKPIIQGGMGVGISLSGLASAVAEEGGIGVISSVALGLLHKDSGMKYKDANLYFLRDEIRKAKAKTNGVIGVNIMVALTDYDELVRVSIEEEADVIIMGAGLPLKFSKDINPKNITKTAFIPIVSSRRALELIFKYWEKAYNRIPDGVIVEGPKAGGHLGYKNNQIDDPEFELEKIIPEVVEAAEIYEKKYGVSVPVIAAGGIYDGADIDKYLAMGASGVQMGTRFVATHECDASLEFKRQYINSKKEDITLIKSPVGLPGRAINNTFLEDVTNGMKKPIKCSWKCLKTCNFRTAPYCIADALFCAQKGDFDNGYAFAGSNAYRLSEIISVSQLFSELQNEYAEVKRLSLSA